MRNRRKTVYSHPFKRKSGYCAQKKSYRRTGKIIFKNGGIIGLNFHNAFLNNEPEKACIDDILKHTEHFLSLGGEDYVCLGSDFDGGILPYDIRNNRNLYEIYNLFLQKNYQEAIIDKIFYENAVNFFENFDI